MNKKYIKRYWQILLVVGTLTLIFGVTSHKNMTGISPNVSMFNGMIQGAGCAFAAIGGFKLLQNKTITSEKRKAKEIELNDERNIAVTRISLAVSSTVGTIIFGVLSFVFVALDYIVPAMFLVVAIYIQLIALFIAYKYYNKKM